MVFKAILVACLPLLLLYPGGSWRGIVGVFISLLVLGPWFSCDSRLFFVILAFARLLLGFLHSSNQRQLMPSRIAILFVLWVNLDRWFFLGLLILFLDLMGRSLETPSSPTRGNSRLLLRTFLIAILACLINPSHILVFDIRATLGLTETARIFQADPLFRELFTLPTQGQFWRGRLELNIGEFAYLLLVCAGVPFRLSLTSAARALVTLLPCGSDSCCSVSLFQRPSPFFAIIAGPILAENMQ